jgi:Predicted phosphoribosyltransferases
MIDAYLAGEDWDEAPEEMAFEATYGEILAQLAMLVARMREGEARIEARDGASTAEARAALCATALRLYVRAPALVNVALNYKICAEHGLPLHPTVYYELAEAKRYDIEHSLAKIDLATRIYRASIELARAAYRLDPLFEEKARAFGESLPEEIGRFVYTGSRDKYSWRGSEPEKLIALTRKICASYEPELVVAAAHGAIMPALLLAEYLGRPLYFVRFSMFKRKDEAPIVSMGDELWLSSWKEKRALLFDEDVAKGTTLELFAKRLAPLFAETRSACTIRHAGSSYAPDFVARYWWD